MQCICDRDRIKEMWSLRILQYNESVDCIDLPLLVCCVSVSDNSLLKGRDDNGSSHLV